MIESQFPIDKIKNLILDEVEDNDFVILKSTPGSGKTTRVPLFLKEKYQKKIYILEPRRLAAKMASHYVAKTLNESVGSTVGHIFKYENQTQISTKIIFLTEGSFLRILSNDDKLSDCDIVILDEFHERHFHTDVALGYLLKIKETNKKLKIIIMSATMNTTELEVFLSQSFKVKIIELAEKKYNLEVIYLPNNTLVLKDPIERKVLNAIENHFETDGHILVFLPGMYEIRKCEEIILRHFQCEIIVLHGDLAAINIDDKFYDLKNKKIILSTNIAESSITIPGLRVVIDSGLHKISRLSPLTRLPLVELKKNSRSSAIQRANRASRESDGVCVRLYSELDFLGRNEYDSPEILRTDLSELYLNTQAIFNLDLVSFKFFAHLPLSEIEIAKEFLIGLGFINNNELSVEAKKIMHFPFHPRVLKILNMASSYNKKTFLEIVFSLAELIEPKNPKRFQLNCEKYFSANHLGKSAEIEYLFLFGFFDQIACLKETTFIHRNGQVLQIHHELKKTLDLNHRLWIILGLDNRNQVVKAKPIEEEWLYELPILPLEEFVKYDYESEKSKLKAEVILKIGSISLSSEKLEIKNLNQEAVDYVYKKTFNEFDKKIMCDEKFKRLLIFEKLTSKTIDDFDISNWYKNQIPFFVNNESFSEEILIEMLVLELFNFLNEEGVYSLEVDLPLFLNLSDKRKVQIHYESNEGIYIESFIQDFYGLSNAPQILKGKETLKIHLLGPHKRAIQVTKDLKNFWENTYHDLLSELKREYPRHYWPDQPNLAKPIFLKRNVN